MKLKSSEFRRKNLHILHAAFQHSEIQVFGRLLVQGSWCSYSKQDGKTKCFYRRTAIFSPRINVDIFIVPILASKTIPNWMSTIKHFKVHSQCVEIWSGRPTFESFLYYGYLVIDFQPINNCQRKWRGGVINFLGTQWEEKWDINKYALLLLHIKDYMFVVHIHDAEKLLCP